VSDAGDDHVDGLYLPCGFTQSGYGVFCKDHEDPSLKGRITPFEGTWTIFLGASVVFTGPTVDESKSPTEADEQAPSVGDWVGTRDTGITPTIFIECSAVIYEALLLTPENPPPGSSLLIDESTGEPRPIISPAQYENFVRAIAATTLLGESQIKITSVEGNYVYYTLDLSSTPSQTESALKRLSDSSKNARLTNWLNHYEIKTDDVHLFEKVITDTVMSPSPSPLPSGYSIHPSPLPFVPPRHVDVRDESGCLSGSKYCEVLGRCIDSRAPCAVPATDADRDCLDVAGKGSVAVVPS
jgi:hypothetical protein